MKRATFRLQPVLELRRTEERAAAAAAAEAANAAAVADRRATEYEMMLAAAVLPRSLPAGQFLAAMTLLRTAATDASDARALATASAEPSELVRARWRNRDWISLIRACTWVTPSTGPPRRRQRGGRRGR